MRDTTEAATVIFTSSLPEHCLCGDFPDFEFVGFEITECDLLRFSGFFHAIVTIREVQELGGVFLLV